MDLTAAQYDAILDATETIPELKSITDPMKVAEILHKRGHALFKTPPATKPMQPARTSGEPTGLDDMPAPRGEPAGAANGQTKPAQSEKPKRAPELPATQRHIATGLEGFEGLRQQDIKVPMLKIRQNVSGSSEAEDVPPGHIFLSSDPAGSTPARKLRVLDIAPGRSFMMPYKDAKAGAALRDKLAHERHVEVPDDAKVACSSFDGMHPVDRGWGVLSATCDRCPYTKWQKIAGERVPPDCGENYRYMVLDEDTGMPAVLITQKGAIPASKNLNTNLLMLGKRTKTPSAGFVIEMSTKEQSNGKDKWFAPVFGRPIPGKLEDTAAALEIRAALMSRPIVVDGDGEQDEASA